MAQLPYKLIRSRQAGKAVSARIADDAFFEMLFLRQVGRFIEEVLEEQDVFLNGHQQKTKRRDMAVLIEMLPCMMGRFRA